MYNCVECGFVSDRPNRKKKSFTATGREFITDSLCCPDCGGMMVKNKNNGK